MGMATTPGRLGFRHAAFTVVALVALALVACEAPATGGAGSSSTSSADERGSSAPATSSPAATTSAPSSPGTPPGGRRPGVKLPAPDERIPTRPGALATRLVTLDRRLRAAVDRWVGPDGVPARDPPRDVVLLALFQQRAHRAMALQPGLAEHTLARLPPRLALQSRRLLGAARELLSLVHPVEGPITLRTKPPDPPGLLLRSYREAERRFRVDAHVLAAVNFVESKFGRARSASPAGAQGPMQFIPSTWDAYGLGGDVLDPHDAILGAANLLRASGAPGDYRRALFAYNHADAYVDAVLLYADAMRADPHAFFELYNWQVFVLTPGGHVQLTGPGVDARR